MVRNPMTGKCVKYNTFYDKTIGELLTKFQKEKSIAKLLKRK